jgi:hypothetical protein
MDAKRHKIFAVCVLTMVCSASAPAQRGRGLDTAMFIVVGEGLSAGMANYGLSTVVQQYSFPAQMAAQMKTAFLQPLIQPPGIGDVVGYPGQEVRLQTYPQGSVRQFFQTDQYKQTVPSLFIMNLSVPGFTLADSISMRPVPPIAQRNMKQTVVNMILGFPQLFFDNVPLWSQLEYAKAMNPSLVLVELGYYEALDAAVTGDATRLPDPNTFRANYTTLLAGLRANRADVIATTIPNPLDTAYFATPSQAAGLVATSPFILTAGYHLSPGDYITRNGMETIAAQFWNRSISPLPPGSILTAAVAVDITNRVNALNAEIVNAAKANGVVVYDLNAFFHKVRVSGAKVGSATVTADYLGGFYSLDAVYPGATGHALIANGILTFVNQTYSRSYPLVDLGAIAAIDPALAYQRPGNGRFNGQQLHLSVDQPLDTSSDTSSDGSMDTVQDTPAVPPGVRSNLQANAPTAE